jgi:hypothetical protein
VDSEQLTVRARVDRDTKEGATQRRKHRRRAVRGKDAGTILHRMEAREAVSRVVPNMLPDAGAFVNH